MKRSLFGGIKHPWRWLISALVIVLLATGGVLGYRLYRRVQSQNVATAEDSLTVPVERSDIRLEVIASGTVVPVKNVNLSPKTAGRLAELLVEQGDAVEAGQIVARMESNDIQAQLIQAEAKLAGLQARLTELKAGNRTEDITQAAAQMEQAEAQVNEAKARLSLAQQRLSRNQTMYSEGAISQDDLDAVQTEADVAEASLAASQQRLSEAQERLTLLKRGTRSEVIEQAAAQVQEAEGRLQAIQVQLEDTLIRAPFAGTITQRYAEVGAFVTPTTSASATASATSTSIVALAQGLEIRANVPEVDVGQIDLEQTTLITSDAFPDETFEGEVRLIAPEAVQEQNVTSFQVRVSLLEGLELLRSGMNVDVTFVGKLVDDALVVPTVSIVTQKGRTGVFIPDEKDEPEFKQVLLGPTLGDRTQILEGLEAGEQVFIDLPKGDRFTVE